MGEAKILIRDDAVAASQAHGEVERKLGVAELLWNDGFVRKAVIIVSASQMTTPRCPRARAAERRCGTHNPPSSRIATMIWTRPPGKNATGNTARTPLAFEQPGVAHAEHERRSRKGGDHSCCRAGHGRPLQARPGHATSCGIPPSLQAGTVGGYRSLGEPLRRMLSQDRTGWSPEQSGSGDLPHRVRADDLAPCRRDNGTSPISPPEPGGGQIKSGAPARGERVGKYNRLMEIATAAPGSASRALHPAARAPGPLLPAA